MKPIKSSAGSYSIGNPFSVFYVVILTKHLYTFKIMPKFAICSILLLNMNNHVPTY